METYQIYLNLWVPKNWSKQLLPRCSAAPGWSAARCAASAAPPRHRFTCDSLHPSPGRTALGLCLYLLRSHWYLYWGNIAYKQEAYSLSGEKFFMSETENSCSRLCHPFFSDRGYQKVAIKDLFILLIKSLISQNVCQRQPQRVRPVLSLQDAPSDCQGNVNLHFSGKA